MGPAQPAGWRVLHVIEQGIDTSTTEGRAMLGLLAVLARPQRELPDFCISPGQRPGGGECSEGLAWVGRSWADRPANECPRFHSEDQGRRPTASGRPAVWAR
jgi:hypothetical protein